MEKYLICKKTSTEKLEIYTVEIAKFLGGNLKYAFASYIKVASKIRTAADVKRFEHLMYKIL